MDRPICHPSPSFPSLLPLPPSSLSHPSFPLLPLSPCTLTSPHIEVVGDVGNGEETLWKFWDSLALEFWHVELLWVELTKLLVGNESRGPRGPENPVHQTRGVAGNLLVKRCIVFVWICIVVFIAVFTTIFSHQMILPAHDSTIHFTCVWEGAIGRGERGGGEGKRG